ncbi:MAG: glycosyltransferase [Chloroflexi bacterium]|nr:glycosyltransferase [Chloroflexota bacterium]MBV9898107.1 glycosyltransferase [Chloroflexota bacterium]
MDQHKPELSVIVPAFQASATIEPCLRALAYQTLAPERYEIIVVDDGSSDRTADRAAGAGAQVLRMTRNSGPAAARNAGLVIARGQLIVFTDADCEPTPEFLAGLASHLANPSVGGAKGVYLSKQRALVARFVQHEYEDRYRHTARQRSVDFADTYACCYRRADILRAGGFDASLPVCEDQEMSFRLVEAGVHIEFAPDVRTYHHHCEDIRVYLRKKFRIARWKVRVLCKHPSKVVHDSHTPRMMKVEMIAASLLFLTAVLYGLRRQRETTWLPVAFTSAGYLALVAPFVRNAARDDVPVAIMAPMLLLSRDLALTTGTIVGLMDMLRILVHRTCTKACAY